MDSGRGIGGTGPLALAASADPVWNQTPFTPLAATTSTCSNPIATSSAVA